MRNKYLKTLNVLTIFKQVHHDKQQLVTTLALQWLYELESDISTRKRKLYKLHLLYNYKLSQFFKYKFVLYANCDLVTKKIKKLRPTPNAQQLSYFISL